MIFKAILSNMAHPEFGQANTSYPIPDSQYDHTINLLEIGFKIVQDGRVDSLNSGDSCSGHSGKSVGSDNSYRQNT